VPAFLSNKFGQKLFVVFPETVELLKVFWFVTFEVKESSWVCQFRMVTIAEVVKLLAEDLP
jgi:hypothetical protein